VIGIWGISGYQWKFPNVFNDTSLHFHTSDKCPLASEKSRGSSSTYKILKLIVHQRFLSFEILNSQFSILKYNFHDPRSLNNIFTENIFRIASTSAKISFVVFDIHWISLPSSNAQGWITHFCHFRLYLIETRNHLSFPFKTNVTSKNHWWSMLWLWNLTKSCEDAIRPHFLSISFSVWAMCFASVFLQINDS